MHLHAHACMPAASRAAAGRAAAGRWPGTKPGTQKGRWAGPRPWAAAFLGPRLGISGEILYTECTFSDGLMLRKPCTFQVELHVWYFWS